jgi:ribonuclease PH
MNVVINEEGDYIEVQGTAEDGSFKRSQLNDLLDLAEGGINTLIDLQKKSFEA